ncbi:membrane frizzled-related protein [Ornithorhynchus anatinus]|uniref:Membrane frizzled-related protein n=1 Tax=Ornithorhynchus anatinus TaxID=9258 RepID=A0A6I8P7L4_ORNAN|nr:membrane frizzled-related protein [Ornithorhynchus anatinus]
MKNYRDMTLCMETQEPSKTEFCNPAFEPEAGLPSLPVSLGEAGTTPDTCWDGRPHWRHQPDCRFSWLCTGLLSALLLLLLGLLAAIILAQLKSPSPDGVGLPSLAPAYGQANTTVVTIPTAPSDSDARGELGTTPMPQPGCGGLLTDPEGTFSSPNYPSPYPRNAHCVWLIQVAPDRVVQLKVETLSMEALTSCLFDRLEISPEAEEPHLLGGPVVRMCGQVAPATLNTNTSRIRATFVSDGSVEASGFRAWYRAVVPGEGGCAQGEFACDQLLCLLPTSVCDGTFNCADRSDEANCSSKFVDCGGTLTELQGSFHSPNYPQPYPPTQICLWKISVPAGHIIELKFNNFSLEAEDHCHYDFVEVYDNVGIHSSGFLGRFCGTQQPPPLTSSRHVLTVLFVADDGLGGCGFSATYQTLKATEKTCGSDQFSCHDGACQDAQWVCDGWKDCADGSDEFNCSSYRSYRPLESVCEPIQVEVCQDLSYNGTAFPSVWMSLPDQQGAVNVLRDFTSLADLACYQPFRRFLCGLYVPRCVPGEGVLPPCRPVCQEAEWHCQPTLELLGLPWPFNCNVLPEATDPTQCSQP